MDSLAQSFGRTVVIAPHPDDEVLGAGGTIARLAAGGGDVQVVVVTEGKPPAYGPDMVARIQNEAREAHALLGVSNTHWLGLPAAALAETAHATLNAALFRIFEELRPKTVLVPFVGDIHVDHQLIFLSSLVASRPHQHGFPERILAYETLSETNWNAPYLAPNFVPNVFIDISQTLGTKAEAMRCFRSQLRDPPHERSIATIEALATVRGATVLTPAAEAFVLVRYVT
ncbi:PIG-L family deacetylase [Rhizobium sp. TRM95111]|uniref:PIG-L deacetylase family protein n=1 Tax=Rhizobium alarense TaxID=2846851 RepID=UPI001F42C46D|nr:PIG-L deacetylase family protein [Rhizobium alarense]MCF3641815.1 PIG-L family deacetylase [Rhizobium alarense]